MAGLITIDEAQRLVLERARPLPAKRVPLGEAFGRVAAEAVHAEIDLPPFASSAMDGFAVRAADTPGRLPIVDESAAGSPAERPLSGGEAIAIATGAAVPHGADAVIPVEYVVKHDNEIEVPDQAEAGANVRPVGSDVPRGEAILSAGTQIGAAQVGALAAAGVAEVSCGVRPRAAVLATGSELRRPGEPLAHGQIYEANGLILDAQLRSAGALPQLLPTAADDVAAHRAAIEQGLEADVLITTGGVSVGPHDLVREVERELGVEEVFWGVSVKPGKPISFGVRGATLVFGLPGNPLSALVGFELFVRPALALLQGSTDALPRWEWGRLAAEVRPNPQRDELVRGRSAAGEDGVLLQPLAGRESHQIARAAGADVLVLIPRGDGQLDPDTPVRYLRLP